jgi:hypothetical protein
MKRHFTNFRVFDRENARVLGTFPRSESRAMAVAMSAAKRLDTVTDLYGRDDISGKWFFLRSYKNA